MPLRTLHGFLRLGSRSSSLLLRLHLFQMKVPHLCLDLSCCNGSCRSCSFLLQLVHLCLTLSLGLDCFELLSKSLLLVSSCIARSHMWLRLQLVQRLLHRNRLALCHLSRHFCFLPATRRDRNRLAQV